MKPCDSKPSRPAPWPSWKISRPIPKAAAVASRFVTTPSAAMSGARTATSRSRKPSVEHDADHERRLRRSACARSWFSAAAPPTSAPAGRAARSRSMVRPTAGLDGSAFGIACTRARPPRPGLRCEHAGDAGIAPGGGRRRPRPDVAARRSGALRARRRRRPAASARSRCGSRRPWGRP